MCGRYALTSPDELVQEFGLGELPYNLHPRYNIAPTQEAPVVVGGAKWQLQLFRWGLVPRWAKDTKSAARMINARSESVHEKPAFRAAFAKRRCLVCSDGFYEWKREGQSRTPHFIRRTNGHPLTFAGIWESHIPAGGDPLHTFSVLTMEANSLIQPVHHRMPVIVEKADYALWLDPDVKTREPLESLLTPTDRHDLQYYEVSPLVNSPANDTADCLRKGPDQQSLF